MTCTQPHCRQPALNLVVGGRWWPQCHQHALEHARHELDQALRHHTALTALNPAPQLDGQTSLLDLENAS